ncbi:MAG: penicillin-binding protein 2 [Deltaproteobacteria bacterium]|nr:penicillin-binding protein 2 [Deltaproteobacteria bacterium]
MRYHGEIPEFRRRYRYLVVVVVLTFLVLLGRLWHLQIVRGDHYRRHSEDNFVQEQRIPTVRGFVFDRRGRRLISNRPSYDIYVTPRFVTSESLDRLEAELVLDPERAASLRRKIKKVRGRRRYERLLLLRDISRDQLARLETHRSDLNGFSVLAVAHRNYDHGNLAAHVLGYMNEVSSLELRRDKKKTYQPGDLIGRFGVESIYETHLRGIPGIERIVVDAKGLRKSDAVADELLKGLPRRVAPRPGHNLTLTIDLDLQRIVERALRRHPSGAAVVVESSTGRILASASWPSFDPNVLTGRLSPDEHSRLLLDPYRPLLDKVFRENYFPGSTFKVVTALAALGEGVANWDEKITCNRFYRKYRVPKRCSHAHGPTDLSHAIIESCNIYFYTVGERVGLDHIASYARMLGLGASTGLGLNHEVSGFIPTKAWYAKRKKGFRVGYTLNAAIGQGNVKVTPIQLAMLYASLGNGGKLYLPQIVEEISTSRGEAVQRFAPRLRHVIRVNSQDLRRLREALRGVVEDKDGTAYKTRLSDIAVSGKTGTAQVVRRSAKHSYWRTDHAWFAAYAPSDSPEIAVAVLIEHGGRAARVAAPVAMEIIRGYFHQVKPFASRSQISASKLISRGATSRKATSRKAKEGASTLPSASRPASLPHIVPPLEGGRSGGSS